ncbi:MAG: hypothetical protein IT381_11775 [Deltaproteobacteria bacterium]|nr:hypothetical protein [Deltaproteobacteria bacterium]
MTSDPSASVSSRDRRELAALVLIGLGLVFALRAAVQLIGHGAYLGVFVLAILIAIGVAGARSLLAAKHRFTGELTQLANGTSGLLSVRKEKLARLAARRAEPDLGALRDATDAALEQEGQLGRQLVATTILVGLVGTFLGMQTAFSSVAPLLADDASALVRLVAPLSSLEVAFGASIVAILLTLGFSLLSADVVLLQARLVAELDEATAHGLVPELWPHQGTNADPRVLELLDRIAVTLDRVHARQGETQAALVGELQRGLLSATHALQTQAVAATQAFSDRAKEATGIFAERAENATTAFAEGAAHATQVIADQTLHATATFTGEATRAITTIGQRMGEASQALDRVTQATTQAMAELGQATAQALGTTMQNATGETLAALEASLAAAGTRAEERLAIAAEQVTHAIELQATRISDAHVEAAGALRDATTGLTQAAEALRPASESIATTLLPDVRALTEQIALLATDPKDEELDAAIFSELARLGSSVDALRAMLGRAAPPTFSSDGEASSEVANDA